ncbi:MAG TPA: CocE/NonD family hydrolase [Candidatus Thermoplasmatota archaeon]|nr:CocE/NonD family hydrolase [Candidatus Thermoplasmatota archaeon]
MRVLALALALAFALGAGCLAPQPAAVASVDLERGVEDLIYDLGDVLEASIDLADGLALHGTVYLPDVPEGTKVPVIMDMGPYYGNLNPETSVYSAEHPPSSLYEHFLRRGYAIALVSVRGTGLSEGCFMIGGQQENADVAAAIEWLAAQDWSDGHVAMTGVSYDGTTPWEGLVSGAAPHLDAIVPVEGISDHYRYDFFEGVPINTGAAFNAEYAALVDIAYTEPTGVPGWGPAQATHVCPEQLDVFLSPMQTYRDGVHGAFWDERDMSAAVANATAAVFVVHGAKDFNVKMDHVQTIWQKLPGPKRMLVGQWEHNIPWHDSYDPDQSWTQYNTTIDQFLDAYVRKDAAALAAEQAAAPVLVQDSANRTWELTSWPPVESTLVAYAFGADGAMTPGAAKDGEATLSATPASQAQAMSGQRLPVLSAEEIAFETAAFAAPTLFIGNPYVDLHVSVDRPEGILEVRLYEVSPSGEREQVSVGWQNLATRESRDHASDVPTGEPMSVRVFLEGIAQQVKAGDTLQLVIRPDNTDSAMPQVTTTTYTIPLGGDEGARLWLPAFAPGENA